MHFNAASLLSLAALVTPTFSANADFNFYHKHQQQRLANVAATAHQASLGASSKDSYQFYNNDTKPYFIESWPDIDFDTGEMYRLVPPLPRLLVGTGANPSTAVARCRSTSPTRLESSSSSSRQRQSQQSP
jgi:hypothetical protein